MPSRSQREARWLRESELRRCELEPVQVKKWVWGSRRRAEKERERAAAGETAVWSPRMWTEGTEAVAGLSV